MKNSTHFKVQVSKRKERKKKLLQQKIFFFKNLQLAKAQSANVLFIYEDKDIK